MVCTQQPVFSAAMSIQSMFPVDIAVAYLSQEKSIRESFVANLRAAVSNCDTVAPIQWERVCEDLADGFLVDCTRRRYADQEEEATQPEEGDGESQKRPPPPPKSTGKQGDGTPAKAKNSKARASPSQQNLKPGSKPPPNKALGTFAAHFTPSQQTQNERDASCGAKSEMPGDQAPQANGGQLTGIQFKGCQTEGTWPEEAALEL